MKNNMPTNWTTTKKWTNSYQRAISQDYNKEEIENLNRPITTNEIEMVIKTFPTNQSLGLEGFKGKFSKHLKKS